MDSADGLRRVACTQVALPGGSYGYLELMTFERPGGLSPGEVLDRLVASRDYEYGSYSGTSEHDMAPVTAAPFRATTRPVARALLQGWIDEVTTPSWQGRGAAEANKKQLDALPEVRLAAAPFLERLGTADVIFANDDYEENPVRSVYTWHREWVMIEEDRVLVLSAYID